MIDYIPILTAGIAAVFAVAVFRRWLRGRSRRHLFWWAVGLAMFGIASAAEGVTALVGWHDPLFRTWYIAGALLGGAPLAQGTIYLLVARRTADRLAAALVAYVAIAAVFVLLTPLSPQPDQPDLTGSVMDWSWVRAFTPLVNLYAVVFLVGGAAWSAIRYARADGSPRSRVAGNAYIAAGALLPALGGGLTRLGYVEVRYALEFVGLILIWVGYRVISAGTTQSVHAPQMGRDPAS